MTFTPKILPAARRLARSQLSPGQALFMGMLLFILLLCLAVLVSRPNAWSVSWTQISLYCHAWTQGDWLINYNGGFVRRGLAGSLLIPAAEWLGSTPYAVVAGIQTLCFLVIILMAIHLVRHPQPAPLALVLALFSPAVLLFQVEGIDRGRKEIALIAWAAVMAWRAAQRNPLPGKAALAITLLALAALHDGLFFFFPVLLLLVMALAPEEPWSIKSLALVLAPALLLMAVTVWLGPSSEQQFRRIIERFHGNPVSWADSSIGYLGFGMAQAASHAIHDHMSSRLLFMPPTLLLGSLPILAWLAVDAPTRGALQALWRRPPAKAAALAALLGQLALFVVTTDWGRWISIDLFLAAFALLAIHQRAAPAAPPRSRPSWVVLIVALALYSGAWIMHPLCNTLFLSKPSLRLQPANPPVLHISRLLP